MALINCPECGTRISDKAKICPHCGRKCDKVDFDSIEHIKTLQKTIAGVKEKASEICPKCKRHIEKGEEKCKYCNLLTVSGILKLSNKLAPENEFYFNTNPNGRICPRCGKLCDKKEQLSTCSICGYNLKILTKQKTFCSIYLLIKRAYDVIFFLSDLLFYAKDNALFSTTINIVDFLLNPNVESGFAFKFVCKSLDTSYFDYILKNYMLPLHKISDEIATTSEKNFTVYGDFIINILMQLLDEISYLTVWVHDNMIFSSESKINRDMLYESAKK